MIRNALVQDVPAMLAVYAPYIQNTAVTFEYEVPSPDAFTRRFLDITAELPWLVWEQDGAVLGYAYASRAFSRAAYQWDADLSVYLAPEIQRKGVGRRLYEALEDILRKQGYFTAYCIVTSANEASCRFHEAMGYQQAAAFEQCGFKFGTWYGTFWYEKRLQAGKPAKPPVPWREIL